MKLVLLYFATFIFVHCSSQPSDFILLKKNHKNVENFFVGKNIMFTTPEGSYAGKIDLIAKDSIFLTEYDIRQVPTNLGVYMLDTVAAYKIKVNYNSITKILQEKKGFNWSASGASLLGGGVLITAVGLGTWIFTKPGDRYYTSPKLIISAAVLGGIGYLLLKLNTGNYLLGKKYMLEYIHIK